MAAKIQAEVFWFMTLCSVVVGYHRFRGPCCLAHHNTGVTTSKTSTRSTQGLMKGDLSAWCDASDGCENVINA
jgi:hypothetical protein